MAATLWDLTLWYSISQGDKKARWWADKDINMNDGLQDIIEMYIKE